MKYSCGQNAGCYFDRPPSLHPVPLSDGKVQFSNHTQYTEGWQGLATPTEQIGLLSEGIEAIGVLGRCNAVLSGYLGVSAAAGDCVCAAAGDCGCECLGGWDVCDLESYYLREEIKQADTILDTFL